jgi:hypothetical protein
MHSKQAAFLALIALGTFSCHRLALNNDGALAGAGSGAPGGASVAASGETQVLARYVNDSVVTGDVQGAAFSGSINLAGGSAGFFALGGETLLPGNLTCVTVSNLGTAGNFDILETFKCPNITGTVETKGTRTSFDITTKVDLTGKTGSGTIDSDLSLSKDATSGALALKRTFDDTFKDATDSYEAKGSTDDSVTPDPKTPGSGSIQLSQTLDFSKDGVSAGSFSVTSTGLMYSGQCLVAGTIKITGPKESCTLTFTAPAASPIPVCAKPATACVPA